LSLEVAAHLELALGLLARLGGMEQEISQRPLSLNCTSRVAAISPSVSQCRRVRSCAAADSGRTDVKLLSSPASTVPADLPCKGADGGRQAAGHAGLAELHLVDPPAVSDP
jgi:hypothetical protein